MALDQAYFDAIAIDLVKRKYYNANKVEAVFDEIEKQAKVLNDELAAAKEQLAAEQRRSENMAREIASLRQQLASHSERREELTDAVYSAQSVYRVILEKANERADAILNEAEQRRRALEEEDRQQRDFAVKMVEQCLTRVREQQQAALDELNSSWQSFLCGLYPAEEEPAAEPAAEDGVPGDLEARISAIAKELFAIDDLDKETGEEET